MEATHINARRKPTYNKGFALGGWTVRIETVEQLINIGAGRYFTPPKARQRKARNL
jgi:hypothetical protein